jgi:hypothetical protein
VDGRVPALYLSCTSHGPAACLAARESAVRFRKAQARDLDAVLAPPQGEMALTASRGLRYRRSSLTSSGLAGKLAGGPGCGNAADAGAGAGWRWLWPRTGQRTVRRRPLTDDNLTRDSCLPGRIARALLPGMAVRARGAVLARVTAGVRPGAAGLERAGCLGSECLANVVRPG